MAASERLYELWLLYYAQVRPPRPAPAVSPASRAPRQLHLRPRHPGCVDARALSMLGFRTHVSTPGPPFPLAHIPGGDPRGRTPRKKILAGTAQPES